jgi:hypothetical protein
LLRLAEAQDGFGDELGGLALREVTHAIKYLPIVTAGEKSLLPFATVGMNARIGTAV